MTNHEYDNALRTEGYTVLCGVDEAGRGPLAGPVFAAAVILNPEDPIEGLNDSKKLTEKKRETLFDVIRERALAFAIASASVEEIEEYNILNATYLAMSRAVAEVSARLMPDLTLIDGNRIPPQIASPCRYVVKGDALSASIAAASILAKVSRDWLLVEMDAQYPEYAFAQHKGYGTALHYEKLAEFGPAPVHRLSFLKKWLESRQHR
ncbi:MAG: ribonuclease HII [Clostridia bacterium]|nr:ribonuclease HII [Clostridia bacterium]